MTSPTSSDCPLRWRKSSRSTGSGECVEIAGLGGVAVRDSKDPDGPKLAFGPAEWSALTRRIKAGELDL